ncbi:MAG: helix-turn-helix transcriptional regulator [Myxococcales bacterium]|nr:helix-turn-helix transcriptional regulator [Myxococcales bacterium]
MDWEAFAARVGANLRRARHLRGLTLEQAAGGAGATRYLRELEGGARNPSLAKLHELAALYGVTVADLVSVPGARQSSPTLDRQPAKPPPVGRKPKR